ncbi:MAG: glycosyltransferase [Myxococcota bacterium]
MLDLGEFYSERGGGVRSYLSKLVRMADALDHEIVVVAPGPRDELTREGNAGRIIRYAAPRMPYDPSYHWPWRIDRMRAICRKERPDVVQVSSPYIPAAVAATLRSVPVRSYVYHSDPIGCYVRRFSRGLPSMAERAVMASAWGWMRAVCNAGDVTVVSGHWLERALQQKGCRNAVAVPFGIRHEDFGPERRSETLRRRLLGRHADAPESLLLLVAGRLAFDKRQALVAAGVRRFAEETGRPVALCVLGTGPARADIEAAARGIEVTFLPFTRDREEYAEILATADALVHGSMCETYGFVLAETLASGTPVVAPDEGGASALAVPSCSERYPAFGGPEAIANAIERLLARPLASLRAGALALASEQPPAEQHFHDLFALYDRLLHRKR